MKRRYFSLLLIFILTFVITGCSLFSSKEFELTEELIDQNLKKTNEEEIPNSLIVSNLEEYYIEDDKYVSEGLVLVKNKEGQKTFFSLITGKPLFPFVDDLYYTYRKIGVHSVYIYKVKVNGIITEVYDVLGNSLIPKGEYLYVNISTRSVTEYQPEGQITYELETIEYKHINGDHMSKESRIYYHTGKRVDVSSVDSFEIEKKELVEFGLKNYFGYLKSDIFYIFDSKDQLVNKVNLPKVDFLIMDGKIISQTLYEMDDKDADYDLIENGRKYKLVTKSIDMLTGKEKDLDLNYQISYMAPLKDEEGVLRYAHGRLKKIENYRATTTNYYVIIDSNGKIVKKLDIYLFDKIQKFGDKYIDKHVLLDKNLNPIKQINNMEYLIPNSDLLVAKQNTLYGAINSEESIVIPFQYKSLGRKFIDGKLLGIDENNNYHIIDKSGNINKELNLYDSVYPLADGFIYSYEYDTVLQKFKVKIIDYNLNTRFSNLSTSSNYYFDPIKIQSMYGEFQLLHFNESGKDIFVVVGKDLRNN